MVSVSTSRVVFASIFALAATNPPAIQAYYETSVFSDLLRLIATFTEFFLMWCSATPSNNTNDMHNNCKKLNI